jgi:ABC-type Fe3+-hydroxamate transport system substrate-binding protein
MSRHVVTDDLGEPNRLPVSPRRVVSLVPSVSELVWWWHRADRLVGVTDWCSAPPRAFVSATRVRGTKNPDLATIRGLTPDVVLADEEENRALDVARLREAGVAVHVTRVRSLAGLGTTLERLGRALGAAEAAAGTATAIARAADQVRRPARPVRAVVGVWRDRDWWVLGRDTFGASLLTTCGFSVVPQDPAGRYPRHTLDDLLASEPDVVLLPDEPYVFTSGDAEAVRAAGVRVRHVDGTSLWWWGPRTPAALGELNRLACQLARPRRTAR